MIACLCVSIFLAVALRQYMDWENKRRDREQGVYIDPEPRDSGEEQEEETSSDRIVLTDWENKQFRYYL
jgi:ACS family allantoate permease-like MFS transporter